MIPQSTLYFIAATVLGHAVASKHGSHGVGSFNKPPSESRASFRYWLPDAEVAEADVKADIESIADIGAGGVEFLPFYNYGGEIGPPPAGADWSRYGFGTAPFKNLFRASLDAHAAAGLRMDFALGPSQGQGVPSHSDAEGLQWDLVCFSWWCLVPSC